jgi:hypothetical protein
VLLAISAVIGWFALDSPEGSYAQVSLALAGALSFAASAYVFWRRK